MTRYELLDRIGVGGMAEIFRGRALAAGGFEKPVAIKRILPHLCQDTRFVELLIAEAKVLSMLRHRNIVQIFDVGLGDDGQYFLVMEFVSGLDLGRVQKALEIKRRMLPIDLALHIGAEVCEALEHAHVAKDPEGKPMRLVHRDVSPSNILLSQAGEIKLTDFGIAKRAEEATGHGTVRGKFAYISPEQARNEHVDPRSDVFSLGIVLFEILTGRRLFSQLPDVEALRGVREGKIPRARELDGNISEEVDVLLAKALSRDPARRFATAGEFGSALRTLRYSLDVSSGDPSSELARVVNKADSPDSRPPKNAAFEVGESTVIRIHTAAAFSMHDELTAFTQARRVIDRFAEEETRMSKLGPETLRNLLAFGEEPVGELAPPPAQRRRSPALVRKGSITGDEPTSLAEPVDHVVADVFDNDEETIARPSPIRGPGPTTLKRVPPPTGPRRADSTGTAEPASEPSSRAAPAGAPHVVRSAPGPLPAPSGWEAPSFSAPVSPASSATPAPLAPGAPPAPLAPGATPNPEAPFHGGPGPYGPPGGPPPERSPVVPVPNPAAMAPSAGVGPGRPPFPGGYPPMGPPPQLSPFEGPSMIRRLERVERWRTAALILGAITMAVLAFAVTRSCMNRDQPMKVPIAPVAPASPPSPSP
ncbi:MAG: protein kinase [Kofleriaceae bacterium]